MSFDRNEWRKQWRENNPDLVSAQQDRDNQSRKAKRKDETPEERAARLLKEKERRDRWRAANPDKVKRYSENYKKWRTENRERFRETANRQARRKAFERDYGITVDEYERMLASQDHKCAICGTDKPAKVARKYSWRVDHCHKSGKVRGLLCHNCNVSLGLLREDVNTAMRMITYLSKHLP